MTVLTIFILSIVCGVGTMILSPLQNYLNLLWLIPLYILAVLLVLLLTIYLCVFRIDTTAEPKSTWRFRKRLIFILLDILVFLFGGRIHVTGKEIVPTDRKYLLVCNHIFDFDPAVLMYVLKSDIGFIGKKEIYETMPVVGKIIHMFYGLPIDRENNRSAVETIGKAAKQIASGKTSMGIFPEGYCSKDGKLQPMRNGAFKIAKKAKCPIVVATISDTRKIVKNMFRRHTDVYVKFVEVISAEEVAELDTAQIGEKVYDIMSRNISL